MQPWALPGGGQAGCHHELTSTALCSAQAGEPAKAVAFCLSGFLLVLKDPCGVSRGLYFLEMSHFIKISSFSANK